MQLGWMLVFGPLLVVYHVTAVGLFLNERPESFVLPCKIHESATLKCEVHNHTKDEVLNWYRGNRQVDVSSKNSVNSSHVCVYPLTPEDNGIEFSCVLNRDSAVKVTVTLDVQFSPILGGESYLTTEVGNNVQLTCSVKANPQAEMSWRKNGSIITLVKSRYEQFVTSDIFRLNINKVEETDAGIYSCVAAIINKNGTTTITTREIELVVKGRKDALPVEAIAAAAVVGALIILFAMFARRDKIFSKCMKKQEDTSL
ncbi:hypothetical protein GDO86_002918 [Hymenochirus boettgeri]|uniref:Ig-like domain-containing protein n=1 Tax=Hymenochirus boettgeri TaxID=247094 RepID=A0A8T2K4X4_9PIPI|nr:hypothetical protein GDO86_002918 [Hymenochirus boettgeri]